MAPPGINKSKEELIKMLRTFLGDTPEENKLIPDEELSDDKLGLALELALDIHNNTEPFENRTFQTFPSLQLIIHGGAIQALIMAGIISDRNYLNFSDGGIQEVVSDRGQRYIGWLQNLMQQYREQTIGLKTSLNMERGFGIIPSPYGNTVDWL